MEFLYQHQKDALRRMHNGCILNGGVGTGKSRTALAYYYTKECDGVIKEDGLQKMHHPKDLYIITTAKKRDDAEWEREMSAFLISTDPSINPYENRVVVDSWNNLHKYTGITGAFFIFDEQRAVGSGQWARAFIKVAHQNHWILLTATPGDTWMDYCPVFVANGFYKNRSEFIHRHVVFNRYVKYPKVDKYLEVGRLVKLKELITVDMSYTKKTEQHHEYVLVPYDSSKYNFIFDNRWNTYTNEPIQQISELCSVLRKVTNSDPGRVAALGRIVEEHPKVIVFYNYDYELDILREFAKKNEIMFAEWNGHKHEEVPTGSSWMYLVQYSAGSEGWNCVTTNTIVFFSQSYSYKATIQAAGRIDRLNTPYVDLYYYHLKSNSSIDAAIYRCLCKKKDFNERKFFDGSASKASWQTSYAS